MAIFKVYHLTKFGSNGMFPKAEEVTNFPEAFELVAVVDCTGLEDVFRATNHIEKAWNKNYEVIELHNLSPRSTSMGDVVVDDKGVAHHCEGCGWAVVKQSVPA